MTSPADTTSWTDWAPPSPVSPQPPEPTYRKATSLPAVVEEYRYDPPRTVVARTDRAQANLICSDLTDGRHMPILDIDLPAALVPSSTPGHYHLYLAAPMSWRAYRKLLKTLYKTGVIQHGFYAAAKRRGYTSVRPPWVRKSDQNTPPAGF